MTPAALQAKRGQLLREAAALKNTDGTFADDAKRQAFDAKMSEVEALDAPSQTLDERNRLSLGDDPPDNTEEPNLRDVGATDERARVQGIRQACIAGRMSRAFEDKLIADGIELVEAQTRVFQELAKRDASDRGPRPGAGPASQVMVGDDPLVHVRAGIENAIMHRVAPQFFKLEDIGRQYRGMSLLDVARSYLNARGTRTTELSKMELAGVALGITQRGGMHTTSDFPLLLADVARKTLRAAYEEAEQTFKSIGRRVTLPDFKQSNRMQLGDAPALLEVKEHGEFTRGTIAEGKEILQLKTYGRVFAITRQALVNDETEAFSRVPMAFGRTARTLEADRVWAQITSNPVMGDGVVLFHATHGNLDATAAVISVATLGKGRAAMRVQKGLDGTTVLNINPKFLATPAALETTAATFLVQITPAQSSNVNPFAGLLTPLVEPRLDANSLTAWYLFAGPGFDIIEYAYLEGEEGPAVEERIGFDIDGLEIKCRLDFDARVIDWRGVWKNPGV
jgi:phage major head subunit gpT-like protein